MVDQKKRRRREQVRSTAFGDQPQARQFHADLFSGATNTKQYQIHHIWILEKRGFLDEFRVVLAALQKVLAEPRRDNTRHGFCRMFFGSLYANYDYLAFFVNKMRGSGLLSLVVVANLNLYRNGGDA